MNRIGWLAIVAACAACGGGSATAPGGPLLQVAGTYDIRKTVVSDTCGLSHQGDTISNPGEVRHTAGAASFVLNDHGTRDLPGTVNRDGTFALAAAQSLVQNTIPAVDTFDSGRFTTRGFDVRDTTDLQSNPVGGPACRVVAAWSATKQGSPNVIP
jgi:hypothetical protein